MRKEQLPLVQISRMPSVVVFRCAWGEPRLTTAPSVHWSQHFWSIPASVHPSVQRTVQKESVRKSSSCWGLTSEGVCWEILRKHLIVSGLVALNRPWGLSSTSRYVSWGCVVYYVGVHGNRRRRRPACLSTSSLRVLSPGTQLRVTCRAFTVSQVDKLNYNQPELPAVITHCSRHLHEPEAVSPMANGMSYWNIFPSGISSGGWGGRSCRGQLTWRPALYWTPWKM